MLVRFQRLVRKSWDRTSKSKTLGQHPPVRSAGRYTNRR
jgi:hypothetical protein